MTDAQTQAQPDVAAIARARGDFLPRGTQKSSGTVDQPDRRRSSFGAISRRCLDVALERQESPQKSPEDTDNSRHRRAVHHCAANSVHYARRDDP